MLNETPETVLLHVSDWNYEDKYYELPLSILQNFGQKAKENRDEAWDWLMGFVDYSGENPDKPVKRCDDCVDHLLEEYFFDFENPVESVDDWGFDL